MVQKLSVERRWVGCFDVRGGNGRPTCSLLFGRLWVREGVDFGLCFSKHWYFLCHSSGGVCCCPI